MERQSYRHIVKSSAMIGASSAINVAFGIARSKAMAVLLGPAGVGLFGLYGSITELTRGLAGLGLRNSGVRQIAESVGTGDAQRIARTVTTLRRVAFISGVVGSLLLLAFCKFVSRLTFGDERHAGAIALLSLVVFFDDIAAAQAALVQGVRRIADLARISVFGAFYGYHLQHPNRLRFRRARVGAVSGVCRDIGYPDFVVVCTESKSGARACNSAGHRCGGL